MKHLIPIALAALTVGCAGIQPPAAFAPSGSAAGIAQSQEGCQEPSRQVLSSVVRVKTGDGGHGSAVVIRSGRLLTVAHLLDDDVPVEIEVGGAFRPAYVISIDRSNDIALIGADTGALESVPLSPEPLRKFEPVWAVGYPLSLEQFTTWGHFQLVHGERLYTSAPITSGNSGGGLLHCKDGRFELAGIVQSFHGYQRGENFISVGHLSVSLPIREVERFLVHSGAQVASR